MYDTCILSITYPKGSVENESRSLACIAAEMRGESADKDWRDEAKDNIEAIFQVLNQYLVQSGCDGDDSSSSENDNDEIDLDKKDADNFFDGNSESLDDMATVDSKSILNRCIYALGKGEVIGAHPHRHHILPHSE